MPECVGAFIVREGSVLLDRRSADRSSYPDVWDVFGGHIEYGESRHEALARELFEELGILPARSHYLETASLKGSTHDAGITCHFNLVTEWNGTPSNRQPQEHSEIRWFQPEEATQLALASLPAPPCTVTGDHCRTSWLERCLRCDGGLVVCFDGMTSVMTRPAHRISIG